MNKVEIVTPVCINLKSCSIIIKCIKCFIVDYNIGIIVFCQITTSEFKHNIIRVSLESLIVQIRSILSIS
jgi:hypothetical protein